MWADATDALPGTTSVRCHTTEARRLRSEDTEANTKKGRTAVGRLPGTYQSADHRWRATSRRWGN